MSTRWVSSVPQWHGSV